jgi:ABC-type antimicrobial peptide transport system permease subunit
MEEYVERDRAPYRFSALVVGSLAGAAFVLAITGIYGLTTVIVSRRSRELGVRLALGASPSSVVLLVLRQILAMLALGSTAGLVGTFMTRAFVRAAMPASSGSSTDPVVLAGAVVLLGVTSLVAACGPALRSARIDPRVALQAD